MKSSLICVLAVTLGAPLLRAELVYSTFGAISPGFDPSNGAAVVGPAQTADHIFLAEQFVPSADVYVDTVTLAFLFPTPLSSPATATISILPNIEATDAIDTTPANLLLSATIDLPLNTLSAVVTADFNALGSVIGANDGRVAPNNAYWVTVTTSGLTEFIWADSTDTSLESFQAMSTDEGANWASMFRANTVDAPPLAAFSVNGTPATIPEPAAWQCVGLVLSFMMLGYGRYVRAASI